METIQLYMFVLQQGRWRLVEELATAKPSNSQREGRQNFWNYTSKEQWPKGATLGVLLNFEIY